MEVAIYVHDVYSAHRYSIHIIIVYHSNNTMWWHDCVINNVVIGWNYQLA